MKRFCLRLGIVLAILAALAALGPLWYWALFGISHNVGTAWAMTSLVLGLASGFAMIGTMP